MERAQRNDILCETTADSLDADEQEDEEEACPFRAVTKDPYRAFVCEGQENHKLYNSWNG